MNIQAEVSLYPLRTRRLSGPIRAFCDALARNGVDVAPGPMSTRISGECTQVFGGLAQAFASVAAANEVVLVAKVSISCPRDEGEMTREQDTASELQGVRE